MDTPSSEAISSSPHIETQANGTQAGAKGAAADALQSDSASMRRAPLDAAKQRADALAEIPPRDPVDVNLRTLLQAGVHFGHQTSRWNPAMAPCIYGQRNGIHIIDLPKTLQSWQQARQCIVDVVGKGGAVLFVGTKKQAQDAIVEEARRCGAFYVSRRWLGGMMTNFQTIRKSISRMNRLEEILAEEDKAAKEGTPTRYTKKERLMMSRELEKLQYSLGGIREMYSPPQLLFVIDIRREDIAIKEARRIDIPVVALVDTNCDPAMVSHPIPSNDDGTRAIRLFAGAVADAVAEGKANYAQRRDREGPTVPMTRRPKAHDVVHADAAAAPTSESSAEQGARKEQDPAPDAADAAGAAANVISTKE